MVIIGPVELAQLRAKAFEVVVDVNRRVALRSHPYDPVLLGQGAFLKAAGVWVKPAETFLMGQFRQPPIEGEGPGVIGTDKAAFGVAAALRQAGAAMLAGVDKGARPAILAAHDQQWHAGVVIGDIVARSAQVATHRDDDRLVAEQGLAFSREPLRTGV